MTFYIAKSDKKGIRIEDLPPEAWEGLPDSGAVNLHKLYASVSWLYRCIDIRANAVASMPHEIVRGETVVARFDGVTYDTTTTLPWLDMLPGMLRKTEASVLLSGSAYWGRLAAVSGKPLGFTWLLSSGIDDLRFGNSGELLSVRRRLSGGRSVRLEANELVYFWYPDPSVETGPARSFPGLAVMANAGVIHHLDLFLAGYFERGMVKATLLKYKDRIDDEEKKAVKEWWKRVFTGIRNAFATEVVRGDFETMTIGEGVRDLRDNVLTLTEREAIASGLGVPQSKVSANAANFATKQSDDVMFVEDTIIPEVGWLYANLNEQLFAPLGVAIKALPERLRIMQQDENERSTAFRNYVGSGTAPGLPVLAVIDMLGLDIDEKYLEELAEKPEPPEPPAPPPPAGPTVEDMAELLDRAEEERRFRRWSKRHPNKPPSEFSSELLTEERKLDLLRAGPAGPVLDYIPDIDEADLEELDETDPAVREAVRRFDALLPKFRGLLDAEIEEDADAETPIPYRR